MYSSKDSVAIRSATPSPSTSPIAGTPSTCPCRRRPDRTGRIRALGPRAAGTVELRGVVPEDRPILAGQRQERHAVPERDNHVADAVAVEVGRILGELERGPAEPDGPQPGVGIATRRVGDSGPRRVPDRLTGGRGAADDCPAGPFEEIGRPGAELDGADRGRVRHRSPDDPQRCRPGRCGFPTEQPPFIERELVTDDLAAIDDESVRLPQPPQRAHANPVIAVGQGERGPRQQVDRVADSPLARFVEHLEGHRRAVVLQLDAAGPPRVVPAPNRPAAEHQEERSRRRDGRASGHGMTDPSPDREVAPRPTDSSDGGL